MGKQLGGVAGMVAMGGTRVMVPFSLLYNPKIVQALHMWCNGAMRALCTDRTPGWTLDNTPVVLHQNLGTIYISEIIPLFAYQQEVQLPG